MTYRIPQTEIQHYKHPDLLQRINELSIAIKAWKYDIQEGSEKMREVYPEPTWEEINSTLMEAHAAIREQTYNPKHY